MKRIMLAGLAGLVVAGVAQAAPPPPPPEHVHSAWEVLAGPISAEAFARLASATAPEVKVYENGLLVAEGRPAWVAFARRQLAIPQRRVIGHAESSAGYSRGGGELLVVDVVDTVDRSKLPPHVIADPRLETRAFLYQFGGDGLIHTVRITAAAGFWEPRR